MRNAIDALFVIFSVLLFVWACFFQPFSLPLIATGVFCLLAGLLVASQAHERCCGIIRIDRSDFEAGCENYICRGNYDEAWDRAKDRSID